MDFVREPYRVNGLFAREGVLKRMARCEGERQSEDKRTNEKVFYGVLILDATVDREQK